MIARATGRAIAWRRRGDNALRIVAAVPVGYGVASLWAMALARILPMAAAQAAVTGALVAFALCALCAMYAYAARSGARALWVLLAFGGIAGAIAWGSIATSGRL